VHKTEHALSIARGHGNQGSTVYRTALYLAGAAGIARLTVAGDTAGIAHTVARARLVVPARTLGGAVGAGIAAQALAGAPQAVARASQVARLSCTARTLRSTRRPVVTKITLACKRGLLLLGPGPSQASPMPRALRNRAVIACRPSLRVRGGGGCAPGHARSGVYEVTTRQMLVRGCRPALIALALAASDTPTAYTHKSAPLNACNAREPDSEGAEAERTRAVWHLDYTRMMAGAVSRTTETLQRARAHVCVWRM
jgi:hypothetical protein